MNIQVKVKVKSVFGRELIYPANDTATTLAKIAGSVTLTMPTLKLAREMGMTVQLVNSDESTPLAKQLIAMDSAP